RGRGADPFSGSARRGAGQAGRTGIARGRDSRGAPARMARHDPRGLSPLARIHRSSPFSRLFARPVRCYPPRAAEGPRRYGATVEPNEIRELIELISKSSFTTFELERNGFRLKLVRAEAPSEGRLRDAPARSEAAVVAAEASRGTEPAPASPEPPAAEDSGLREQLSPIVGTFYSSASPG